MVGHLATDEGRRPVYVEYLGRIRNTGLYECPDRRSMALFRPVEYGVPGQQRHRQPAEGFSGICRPETTNPPFRYETSMGDKCGGMGHFDTGFPQQAPILSGYRVEGMQRRDDRSFLCRGLCFRADVVRQLASPGRTYLECHRRFTDGSLDRP